MKNRTLMGLISSLSLLIGSFFVGILLTPFMVVRLGVEAYGLIPLSFSVSMFLALTAQVLSAVINQKLVASEGSPPLFNHYFSVFFYVCVTIAVVSLVAIGVARVMIVESLNVAVQLRPSAQILVIASAITVSIGIATTPINAVVYAVRGVNLINFAQILDIVVRVVLILSLFTFVKPSLESVAIALCCGAIAAALAKSIAAITQRPSLRLVSAEGAPATLRSLLKLGAGVVLIRDRNVNLHQH